MAKADYKLLALYEVNADKAIDDQDKFNDGLKETGEQFGNMKKELAALGVGLAAAGATFKKAFDLAEEGAAIQQTEESYMGLMRQLGVGEDILERQQAAVSGTISEFELMASTQTLLAGASDELAQNLAASTPELLEIAKAANKLNPTLGDTTFLYDSLALGIKRASPMILDNLGLTISIGQANEKYAESLGKTVDELTEEEKKIALLNATLDAGDNLIKQVGGSTDSATDTFARLRVKVKETGYEFKVLLMKRLEPAIRGFLDFNEVITEHRENLFDNSETYQEYREELMRVHGVQGIMSGNIKVLSEEQFLVNKAVEEGVEAYMALHNEMGQTSEQIQTVEQDTWALVASEEEAKAALDNLKNLMSGDLSQAYARVKEDKDDLIEKSGDIRAEIAELEGSWKSNTTEGQEQLGKLYDELEEVEGRIVKVEEAWRRQTGMMIASIAEKALAVDGFTTEELKAYGELVGPNGLGLLDEAYAELIGRIGEAGEMLQQEGDQSADYVNALGLIQDGLQDTTADVDALADSLRNIPTSVHSTVTVTRPHMGTINPGGPDRGFERGGNFVVPPRFVNDSMPIRVGAGEEVDITSRQDRQRQDREGGGNSSMAGVFDGAIININNGMDLEEFQAMFIEMTQSR